MSTETTPDETFTIPESSDVDRNGNDAWKTLQKLLGPLASLKLTVTLFALSLVLIMAGTLAQTEPGNDIWNVIREYFRCWFCWLDLGTFQKLFAPYIDLSDVSSRVGIWFPGGWTIGWLMGLNLLSAHLLKFRVQAKGTRLLAGLCVLAIGMVGTGLVIASGHSAEGVQETSVDYDTLWTVMKVLTGVLLAVNVWGVFEMVRRKKSEAILLIGTLFVTGMAAWYLFFEFEARFDDSAMRILWQLAKALAASVPMLVGCFLLFKKRGGVVLLHGGIALIMVNEVVVTETHVETQMRILEGQTVNYAYDIRELELAFLDESHKEHNVEVLIPEPIVREAASATGDSGRVISHEKLPFDVRIDQFMQNSDPISVGGLVRRVFVKELQFPPRLLNSNLRIVEDMKAGKDALDRIYREIERQLRIDISSKERDEIATVGDLVDLLTRKDNPATTGAGTTMRAVPVRAGAGTDSNAAVDFTATYVTLLDKESNEPLETLLLSVILEDDGQGAENRLAAGDKDWHVSLRFRRYYKPYTVHLEDVSKEDYVGTSTPRDYRSIIHLVDVGKGTDFEKHIWMNNPLRYAGETFYQSSYLPADPFSGTPEITTLSVVQNTGWMIPYVACVVVGVGMLGHFWVLLIRFLNRRGAVKLLSMAGLVALFGAAPMKLAVTGKAKPKTAPDDDNEVEDSSPGTGKDNPPATDEVFTAEPEETPPRSWLVKLTPWVTAGVMLAWLLKHAMVPRYGEEEANYYEFGRLPVVYEGRVKPLDTLARNSLRIISNRETWLDYDEDKQPAILWFLDVIANPDQAKDHQVIRIDHPQLVKLMDLERRKSHLYSIDEVYENITKLTEAAEAARKKDKDARSADERKVLELERKIGVIDLLMSSFNAPPLPEQPDRVSFDRAVSRIEHLDEVREAPRVVPPNPEGRAKSDIPENLAPKFRELLAEDDWRTFPRGWMGWFLSSQVQESSNNKPVTLFAEILVAHGEGDAAEFNKKVLEYQEWLAENQPETVKTEMLKRESFFNNFGPFYYAAFSYLTALLLALVSLFGMNAEGRPAKNLFRSKTFFESLNLASFLLIAGTFIVHWWALEEREAISGRPPVTNLYSSAIFIGWGSVILGMIFEAIYRGGVGNIIASAVGAATLGIAHQLAGDGDTFKVMQAVLDTQFWLATHVVCITFGYAATFVAGALGKYYVLNGFSSRQLTPEMGKNLSRMIYGTICFGTLLSFVGTVLGGLWADDSWGRFWGWDPKENGALMIVLWNALVLHARWDGLVKERGMATLAVVGNIITSWSWFGVNELGAGLHSYGFTEGVWAALWAFWISQLIVVAIGALPKPLWTCFRHHNDLHSEIPDALWRVRRAIFWGSGAFGLLQAAILASQLYDGNGFNPKCFVLALISIAAAGGCAFMNQKRPQAQSVS